MKDLEEVQAGKCSFLQVVAALSVSLGSLVIGFTFAYLGVAVQLVVSYFGVNAEDIIFVGDIWFLLAIAGGLAGGISVEYIGRKKTILLTPIPYLISWLIAVYPPNIETFLIGCGISGFSTGVLSVAIPVYLSEVLQPKVRGILGFVPPLFVNFGILICSVGSIYANWLVLAYVSAGVSVAFLAFMIIIPETPRWYISHRHADRARKALVWLKEKNTDVEPELRSIIRSHSDADIHARNNICLELIKRSNLKPFLISMGLMFFQQLSGINTLLYYQYSFLVNSGLSINFDESSIILSLINITGTIFAGILIDRLGRKSLLYISNIIMIIALFVIIIYYYAERNGTYVRGLEWIPLFSLVIYMIGYALGFSQIPWLVMAEILPGKIRGPAAGIASALHWACFWLISIFNLKFHDKIEGYYVLWLYGSICIIGIFFIRFCVPETKGKTLEDIEYEITDRKRSMPAEENIYPELLKV